MAKGGYVARGKSLEEIEPPVIRALEKQVPNPSAEVGASGSQHDPHKKRHVGRLGTSYDDIVLRGLFSFADAIGRGMLTWRCTQGKARGGGAGEIFWTGCSPGGHEGYSIWPAIVELYGWQSRARREARAGPL